jgi:hypothetical protein
VRSHGKSEEVLAGDDRRATIGAPTPAKERLMPGFVEIVRTINEREPGAEEDFLRLTDALRSIS